MNAKKKGKTWNTMTIAMIPICIAINFVGANIANTLKLPCFLDAVGTIMMGAICGPVAGAVMGIVSTFINMPTNPQNLAYIVVAIVGGVVPGLASQKKGFDKLWKVLVIGVVLACCSDLLSTPVTAYLYGGITATGQAVINVALQAMGMSLIPATLLSGIISEMIDKVISCLVAFVVIKAMSDRVLSRFPLGYLYMKNVVEAEDEE